ncbi:c-type cytochrome [Thalassospiraceae bacterium LMO-SO8]|nr:c-type cytochrome [Thalassospiraceae bacterium LMO-SO8]
MGARRTPFGAAVGGPRKGAADHVRAALRRAWAGLLAAAAIAAASPAQAAVAPDPVRGKQIYDRCLACHAVAHDRVGPRHCGLKGRRAGSLPGFDYSGAMRAAGFIWNNQTLDRFLADPLGVVPGTTMTYDGVKDDWERRDLVAYLLSLKPCNGR